MSLKQLYLDTLKCTKCPLHKTRKKVVFGDGPKDANIMMIGEAPGKTEDIMGRTFVGPSGNLIDKLLKKAGLPREDVFFTNTVCCRATKTDTNKFGNIVTLDRPPYKPEIAECWPRLAETIRLVDPLLIVSLGGTAISTLMRKDSSITAIRGTIHTMKIRGVEKDLEYSVLPTLHPAYLLRNPDTSEGGWAQKVLEDFIRAANVNKEAKKWLGN
jgi:DNA polymerase